MRKRLLLAALLIVSQLNFVKAQPLFNSPDTVCPKQSVQLTTNVKNALTHYWGFCSGYAFNAPIGYNLGNQLGVDAPGAIEVEKDGDNYYAFVVNRGNAGGIQSLCRLEFGKSLDNIPKITNYGTMDNVLPFSPNALHIVKDTVKGNWHVFVVGGNTTANSSLARLDFGKTLANTPNVVNFGNYNNLLNKPVGLFIYKEAGMWYGYTINKATNNLIRIEYDSLLSLTPALKDLGNISGVTSANDFAVIRHNGGWHFFITNETGTTGISRMDLGPSLGALTSAPTTVGLGDFGILVNPTGITIVRDCDSFHIFVNSKQNNSFVRIDMISVTGPYSAISYSNLGSIVSGPTGLTRAIRDHDNIFLFETNDVDSNLIKIKFQQCSRASIQNSTTMKPPPFSYDTAGIYNLYYIANEGLPDVQTQCKLIYVLPTPPIIMSPDTVICQGDTISLKVLSVTAKNKTWSPDYNISSLVKDEVRVWPRYSTAYHILMPFPAGCIVDTNIKVTVRKVEADAGPDRTLGDGASTMLGGPMTSLGTNFKYLWWPDRYIDNINLKNPVVTPPYDYTYYLTVKDTSGCAAVDTVVVRVGCESINMPNAFVPEGDARVNRFGLANTQIVKLIKFEIFDRWGKKVFTTTDPTKQWDGQIDGEPGSAAVYVWVADGFCASGKRITATGNVQLIR
ncbi:MAG: gliding motility-associated C-terminal domain-containing protein [Bacteroidetes bacterium]|nr:gliding motility-associated C-terminal domain-containing protein [Bacteroidota bacterium]